MKRFVIVLTLLIRWCTGFGQVETVENNSWEVSLSYTISSIAADFGYDDIFDPWPESVLTRSLSIGSARLIKDNLYLSAGILYRTTGFRRQSGVLRPGVIISDAYTGPYTEEWQEWYFDLPVGIGVKTRLGKRFRMKYDIGIRTNYTYYEHWADHYRFNRLHDEFSMKAGAWSMGVEIGVSQYLNLSKRIDLLIAERAAYYIIGNLEGLSSVELCIGAAYKF